MSDFADVEQFAREHAACGGLTPNATSRPGREGYHLTITCACGATHDRWVTAEEASRPLPRPASRPVPASATAPTPSSTPAWPARPSPPRAQRIELTVTPSRGRAVWLVLLLLVAGGAAAVYVTGVPDVADLLGQRATTPSAPAPSRPPAASPPAAAPPAAAPLPALDTIARSLRELQSSTAPGVSLNDYASRVASTRVEVERLADSAPQPARAQVHEVLDLHRLAVGAWRGRTVDDKSEWERIGQDPAVDLCPAVKRAVDAASPSRTASRAQARGAAVSASLPQLWECSAEKTAALERSSGAR
jgi:hypothetical protein